MMLMPIDTCKTVLQVDSVEGFRNLMRKVKSGKIYVLYQGKITNPTATASAFKNVISSMVAVLYGMQICRDRVVQNSSD